MIKAQSTKQQFFNFISNHFERFKFQLPLYLNWHVGIRFDLQIETDDNKEYFKEVLNRANILYNSVFSSNDEMLVLVIDGKFTAKRNKIKCNNYFFKQIQNLKRGEISYFKIKNLYNLFEQTNDYEFNVAVIKCTAGDVNQKNIIKEIAYNDFNILNCKVENKKVLFVNLNKKIMFYMYDDRGLDIIAPNKEIIKYLYVKHKNLILEYNRKEIDNLFN